MTPPLIKMLLFLDAAAKKKVCGPAVCPECGTSHMCIKNGSYQRYLFSGEKLIRIQRYLCKNRQCPRRTFSILPHPFLRIVRLPLCLMRALLFLKKTGESLSGLSRRAGKSIGIVRRAIGFYEKLTRWLDREGRICTWGPSPCLDPAAFWTVFNHDFSRAFFPRKS